jgi:wyosine [tRNA(Phe)-imidazoG37] synthetase (radical SAM superfamily)
MVIMNETNKMKRKGKIYLVNKESIKGLSKNGKCKDAPDSIKFKIRRLTKKEIAMRSQGLIVLNQKDRVVFEEPDSHMQHFFPILINEFAEVAYKHAKFNSPLPILSIDSHDVVGCDFKCIDCLSGYGLFVTKTEVYKNFEPKLESYLHILSEIAEYSKKRGMDFVRFEQSGEGNPDFYKYRPALIKETKERYGMQTVYVTTGSMMSDDLMKALVENAAFIRISFPGIDHRSYALYSRQEKYTFEDSIERLKLLVKMRKDAGRERELLIGARVALRPEYDALYYNFGKTLKEIGIDGIQIVKVLAPEGLNYKDYRISEVCKNQLKKLQTLNDNTFDVTLPKRLDYIYYERVITDRRNFPKICYSARIQPVLLGSGLFVCTKSEIMYDENRRFGDFKGEKGEIEKFLTEDNIKKVTEGLPKTCNTCGNIFDNLLFEKIVKLTKSRKGPLKFYIAIKFND